MGSESDEVNVDDSDGSQLDPKEFQFDDVEFDIPHVSPPSLESILWDAESEEGSDTASLQSFQSLTAKFRSLLCHRLLQGLSAQIKSAGEYVATVCTDLSDILEHGGIRGSCLWYGIRIED